MALVFAFMHFYNIFFKILYCFCPFLFYILFKNLVLINRRNGPRYRLVLALCAFFNRGGTEATNFSKILCSMIVYVLFYVNLCTGLILWFLNNLWFDDMCAE